MGDVTLTGYSGTLENQIDEDIGSILCVDANLMPQIEEGETTLVRVYSAGTNEVIRVRMEKGLYLTIERGLQRTRPSPHPIGACIQGLAPEFNACAVAALLCKDDEALAGLAMCLDSEMKITEQFTLLLNNQDKNTTLLEQTQTDLADLTERYTEYVTQTTTTIETLTQENQSQGGQLAEALECCEENAQTIAQLNSTVSGFQSTIEQLTTLVTEVQNSQQNFNVLDEFTCEELLAKCPDLGGTTGGGGGDDHPEVGFVVGTQSVECRCPENTGQVGIFQGSYTVTYTHVGNGIYQWTVTDVVGAGNNPSGVTHLAQQAENSGQAAAITFNNTTFGCNLADGACEVK